MPEIRLQVDESIIKSINDKLKSINSGTGGGATLSANDIAREALSVYKWAVEQTDAGRAVVATDKDLSQLVQIATPNLPAKVPKL